MWCPACRTEYRDGVTRCADCGTALVDATPPRPSQRHESHQLVSGPFAPDDDVVELMTTTAAEAEVTAAHLRSAGIPAAAFGVDAYSGYGAAFRDAQGARIMVRRGDVEAAAALVRDVVDEPPRPRPVWVRGIATLVLLLILIPVAASSPSALAVVIVVVAAVALTVQLKRRRGVSSRRLLQP
jgi:hypothetical protein